MHASLANQTHSGWLLRLHNCHIVETDSSKYASETVRPEVAAGSGRTVEKSTKHCAVNSSRLLHLKKDMTCLTSNACSNTQDQGPDKWIKERACLTLADRNSGCCCIMNSSGLGDVLRACEASSHSNQTIGKG